LNAATLYKFHNRSLRESAATDKRRGPFPHQLLAFFAGMLAALIRAASQESSRKLNPIRAAAVDLQHLRYAVAAADHGSFGARPKYCCFSNPRSAVASASSNIHLA